MAAIAAFAFDSLRQANRTCQLTCEGPKRQLRRSRGQLLRLPRLDLLLQDAKFLCILGMLRKDGGVATGTGQSRLRTEPGKSAAAKASFWPWGLLLVSLSA